MATAASKLYGADPALLSPLAARLLERGWLRWAITLTASLGAILEVIDSSITNVALPDIRGNLGASLSEAGWIITAYACANIVIIPLSAWLGERFGKKNYFVFSLVGFTIASVMCGLAPNLITLIIARVLQGLAGGGLLAKAQSIVFEAFPAEERGAAQAIFGLGVIVGPALGPVLGGYLTDTLGWRWIFFINIPFGVLATAACLTFLPRDEQSKLNKSGSVDWAGIGLLAVGLGCLQTMLEEGQQDDWFSSRFITLMAVLSAVGLILFVWREMTTEHPAVDLRVLRHPSMIGGSIYSAILGMGIYGIMFAVPIFVQDYLRYTATQSGEIQIPGAIASAITMIVMGKISNRFDARAMIGVGALMTAGTGFLLMGLNPDTSVNTLFWPLILRSIGSVVMFMPLSLATIGPLPKKEIAAGAGFYSLTRMLGSSIGIALITTMLARREATHRSVLVEKVTEFRDSAVERIDQLSAGFSGADPVAAQHQAYGMIDSIVNGQAALLAYSDIFFYVAAAFIVSLPLLLLLGDGKGGKAKEAAAEAH
jgi:MFS transporter, DHA2 family, multidrug resistance protein